MNRRGFLASVLAAGTAPYVLPSGIIMPVRRLILSGEDVRTMQLARDPGRLFMHVDFGMVGVMGQVLRTRYYDAAGREIAAHGDNRDAKVCSVEVVRSLAQRAHSKERVRQCS